MKALSIAGTAAMFLVGGGILVHGLPFLEHQSEELGMLGVFVGSLSVIVFNAVVGIIAGALLLTVTSLFRRARRARTA